MPQFDTMTFFNQVFWLISIVFAFYIIALGYMLPVLAFSLKSRSKNLKFTAALKNKVK
uniref:ATP synthase F0 subunit 8 n=1 Tax=Ectocarpus siliculosus TaxID=2880 RepID=E6ZET6_ECTSI|nr:ATP synthase F0 subunit 8 [Ectocarpus siliculosus]CBJ18028.1 ATP synthase F0 subunit 8 [Ectocarpus siliculosus]